jgi:hypothetical protein
MSRETNQPCPTLYVNNIESKIKKIGAYQSGWIHAFSGQDVADRLAIWGHWMT